MSTVMQNRNRFKPLAGFIGRSQVSALVDCLTGEEGDYFDDMLTKLGERIATMPKTFEQREKRDEAVVYLHYFKGGMDWWIIEKDMETPDEPGQHQAYGYANIGYGAELGYISLVELLENRVELDLYWEPKTVAELKAAGTIKTGW